MRKISTALAAFALFCVVFSAQAQVNQGGEPLYWSQPSSKLNTPEVKSLSAKDNARLLEDAEKEELSSSEKPYQFAEAEAVNYTPDNSGTWSNLPNGTAVWELTILSEGAKSLHFVFDQFHIPEGGELFLYSAKEGEYIGSFTEKNNNRNASFSTYPLSGDEVTLQYVAKTTAARTGIQLELSQVFHAFRDINKIAQALGDSGSCNNNVVCSISAGWENEVNSVAMIVVNGANGSGICTGALINNTANDGHPYFLTANHCTGGGVTNWVFRFNWQSTQCSGNTPNGFDTVSGSSSLAQGSVSDYTLLEINNGNPIPASYNVFFAGWDAGPQSPTSSVGIHHPAGDIKKFSIENNPSTISSYGGATGSGTTHVRVADWDDGTTEGGSSGSPLFDQNHRIVGQLHGGGAACGNNQPDWYGRFFTTFPFVCNWLAPGSCGTTQLDGYNPNGPGAAVDAQIQSITSPTGSSCDGTFTPEVVLRNAGTDALTSVTIIYNASGTPASYSWTGNLASGQIESVVLPQQTLGAGDYTFFATVNNPNGVADQNTNNDSASSNFSIGNAILNVDIVADRYGAETTWEITNANGTVVFSGGPYATVGTNGEYPQPTESACLPNGCYTFTIFDSFGDGICCAYGNGTYTLTDGDGTILASGGDGWTDTESAAFCLDATVTGCTNAGACNYYADATEDDGSCESTSCQGCTNPSACNYDNTATVDDGSCNLPIAFYVDSDGDGYGVAAGAISACSPPQGYVDNADDCDDTRNDVYPGAPGTGEDVDNNCDNEVTGDELSAQPCFADFNSDQLVNVSDLLIMLGEFGCDGDCEMSDMNGDSAVDGSDMVLFLSAFGSICQ